ncbi:MAG: peptide deformylase [Chitinispirillaceae bacterium]|nr:peptide deformylase [Chitinispirillaceae bacterium]
MFDIRIYGDPVLRKTAQPVTAFDEAFRRFIEEMTVTMREKDGVGLAANQVGEAIRVAVIDPTAGEKEPYVLVNPEIIAHSKEIADEEEGCLSIPTIRLNVKRPARVTVKALDSEGKEYTIENAEGILARAIQHEIDHLNGILFVDRVSPLQRRLVAGKLKKLAKSGDKAK